MQLNCSNCGNKDVESLLKPNENQYSAFSDGQLVKGLNAVRTFCNECGCFEAHFTPAEWLTSFYSKQYDLSETVQNNIVFINEKIFNKHNLIYDQFFSYLDHLNLHQGSFLEIACGNGELTEIFSKKFPQWNCIGIDPGLPREKKSTPQCQFIKENFNTNGLEQQSFNIIVAHGLLNRAPTLPHLEKIADLLQDQAMVSFEFTNINQSSFSPYVWDHSFTFTESLAERYLKHTGFIIEKKYNCGSSMQYICRHSKIERSQKAFKASPSEITESINLHKKNVTYWENIKEKFILERENLKNKKIGLFGAGLYTAVLISLVGASNLNFVVVEAQNFGHILPVVTIPEFKNISNACIFLCARPSYLDVISKKLREATIEYIPLNSQS